MSLLKRQRTKKWRLQNKTLKANRHLSQRSRSGLNKSLHQNHSVSKSQLLPLARLEIEIYSFGSLLNLFPSLQDQVQVLHKVLTKGTLYMSLIRYALLLHKPWQILAINHNHNKNRTNELSLRKRNL